MSPVPGTPSDPEPYRRPPREFIELTRRLNLLDMQVDSLHKRVQALEAKKTKKAKK